MHLELIIDDTTKSVGWANHVRFVKSNWLIPHVSVNIFYFIFFFFITTTTELIIDFWNFRASHQIPWNWWCHLRIMWHSIHSQLLGTSSKNFPSDYELQITWLCKKRKKIFMKFGLRFNFLFSFARDNKEKTTDWEKFPAPCNFSANFANYVVAMRRNWVS